MRKLILNRIIGFSTVFIGFLIVLFTSIFFFLEDYSYSLNKIPVWPVFLGMAIIVIGVLVLKSKA